MLPGAQRSLFLISVLALLGCGAPAPAPAPAPQEVAAAGRRFHIRDVVTLDAVPAGSRVRLWIPVPGDDPAQTITGVAVAAPCAWRSARGDIYVEADAAALTTGIVVDYDVE